MIDPRTCEHGFGWQYEGDEVRGFWCFDMEKIPVEAKKCWCSSCGSVWMRRGEGAGVWTRLERKTDDS